MNDAIVKVPISEIPKSKYTGYLWYCDQHKPIVLLDDPLPEMQDSSSWPFVQEGWLFDPNSQQSIHIFHHDDTQCYLYNLATLRANTDIKIIRRLYYAHPRMSENEQLILQFDEIWSPQVDPLCEGMSVLRPAAMIFTGFYKK